MQCFMVFANVLMLQSLGGALPCGASLHFPARINGIFFYVIGDYETKGLFIVAGGDWWFP